MTLRRAYGESDFEGRDPHRVRSCGQRAALILVDGALCYRGLGPMAPLAALLAPHFTVFTYDRRGRGDSGDTAPYAVEREVEDIDASIKEAGGSVFGTGFPRVPVLALEAANRGLVVRKLALYQAPFIVDDTRARRSPPTSCSSSKRPRRRRSPE